MTNIVAVKATGKQEHFAILENGTEIEISRCEYFRLLIGLVLPLAEAGEYINGGLPEAEARRNAEAVAEARKVT